MNGRLEEPLNSNERYLYAIAIRLDAIGHMLSSFIEHYASKNEVATTDNKIEEKVTVEETSLPVDYSTYTKQELVDELKLYGVDANLRLTKSELLELLVKESNNR